MNPEATPAHPSMCARALENSRLSSARCAPDISCALPSSTGKTEAQTAATQRSPHRNIYAIKWCLNKQIQYHDQMTYIPLDFGVKDRDAQKSNAPFFLNVLFEHRAKRFYLLFWNTPMHYTQCEPKGNLLKSASSHTHLHCHSPPLSTDKVYPMIKNKLSARLSEGGLDESVIDRLKCDSSVQWQIDSCDSGWITCFFDCKKNPTAHRRIWDAL